MYNIKFNLNNQEINIPSTENINTNITNNLESHNVNTIAHSDIRSQLGSFGGASTRIVYNNTRQLTWDDSGKLIHFSITSPIIVTMPKLDTIHANKIFYIMTNAGTNITIKIDDTNTNSNFYIGAKASKTISLTQVQLFIIYNNGYDWLVNKNNDNYIVKELLGATGYKIYNTGYCEQNYTGLASFTGGSIITVPFALKFNGCYGALVSMNVATGTGGTDNFMYLTAICGQNEVKIQNVSKLSGDLFFTCYAYGYINV